MDVLQAAANFSFLPVRLRVAPKTALKPPPKFHSGQIEPQRGDLAQTKPKARQS